MVTTAMHADVAGAIHAGTARRRLVVGVDGSPGSYAALRWALEQGRLHDDVVEAVYVLEPIVPLDFTGAGFDTADSDSEDLRAEAGAILDRVVADTTEGAASRVREVVIEHPNPGQALVRAAADAALLIVGGHRHHGFGFLLGSTAASCMRHATCPVVTVPEDWYVPASSRPVPLEVARPARLEEAQR